MNEKYEAIVIGTGFGGAVAACRLAQAGIKVAVFERGRRYAYGEFPRHFDSARGWLWGRDAGIFDVKPVSEMMIVQTAGYGGGSLTYSNVHLRVPADGFARGWPKAYDRAALDPHYDLVAYMLDIGPVRATTSHPIPPKTRAMRDVAEKLGRKDQFFYPSIAVRFDDDDATETRRANKFGVLQSSCTSCGECNIGCNIQAKNTLDLNYLALAERTGNMDLAVGAEVRVIEPIDGGYRVHVHDAAKGRVDVVEAGAVFVCAGAVNTTELLLRCRDEHGTLPGLSAALGSHYSGNGDYLAFAFDTAEALEPSRGPTITAGIVFDRGEGDERRWFVLQDGAYPKELGHLLQLLNQHEGVAGEIAAITKCELERIGVALGGERVGAESAAAAKSALFLAMGRDRANGRMELVAPTNVLRVRWDVPSNLPLYDVEERICDDVAGALGGVMGYNPFWKLLHRPISVHNLGGAVMADSPADGVCGPDGEVFGYPHLFVLDGAALPAATGINPAHTIAAVAERNVEAFIRRFKGDPGWRAPERASAPPFDDPLGHVVVPQGGTAAPATPSVGITFTETMRGFLAPATATPASIPDYVALEKLGEAAHGAAEFTLTIMMADVDAFLADRNHAAVAVGEVRVAGMTGMTEGEGARVDAGVFNLFAPSDSPAARVMLYALPFFGRDGEPYLLHGFKDVRDHGAFDVWAANSTLYTQVVRGHDRAGPVILAGVLHILKADFAHQLTTLRAIGPKSAIVRAEAVARFGHMFLGSLYDVFLRPRLDSAD